MKRVSLLSLWMAVALLSCHPRNHAPDAPVNTTNIIVPLASTPLFYTQLKGKLGNKEITMQLLKTAPNLFRGYYADDSTGQPIPLWGTLDSTLVNIYEETNNSSEDRLFSGYLSDDGKFKGVWHGDGTSYHFELSTDLKNAVPLKVFYQIDSARLFPATAKSPVGTVSNSIIWPDSLADSSVARFIIAQVTGSSRYPDPQKFLRKGIDSFILSYRLSAKDADSSEFTDNSTAMSWNWTTDNDMKVVYNTWPLLVIEKYAYDFTGGAHGNWGAIYKTLDLARQKVLTPEDIFKPDYQEVLSGLLDKAFKARYHMSEEEALDQNLLVKTIPPNNNMIVTGRAWLSVMYPMKSGHMHWGR